MNGDEMARHATKRGFKQSSFKATSTSAAATNKIPAPFRPVTPELQPFADTLPTDHFYVVHIDRTPPSAKTQALLVPSLLNAIILAGLCVRAYYAAPQYLGLVLTVFQQDTDYAIDPYVSSTKEILSMIISRTLLLITDYVLFWFIGSWPREFIAGSIVNRYVGPASWKWEVGVREEEVIVRRGRRWDTGMLASAKGRPRAWDVPDELTIKVKVEAAMRKSYTSRTGLSLLDKDWDLDYKGMIDAHRLLEDGRVRIMDLDEIALVYYQDRWIFWSIHEDTAASDRKEDPKVQTFKQVLTDLGCEDVFFRWIEIVQYESSQPGGFTERRKSGARNELRALIEKKGLDYEEVMEAINKSGGLPGLDLTYDD